VISETKIDYLVIGAGVAGLRAALELAGPDSGQGQVLVATKESVRESNTHYAQGGIAVAMESKADVALHLEDTVAAGDGLVNRAAAAALVREGPVLVRELIEQGAQFDREGGSETGELIRTREAAHSRPRILHANGDATGAEIGRALAALARDHERIQFAEWTTVTELVLVDGRVVGAELVDREGRRTRVSARAVLVASGGAGQVYPETTNPAVATGDGVALAARAGAELADMEFYQFHPTALALAGVPAFLLSEALRGEGAWLVNESGERFMKRYSPMLELAPRDVVARAVAREGMDGDAVYLDMRHVKGVDLRRRFPGISAFLAAHGLALAADRIPIRSAAHYMMGGVRTDLDGRTNLPGLYAAGEAACTGLHGANRLASNSLLEGLVFGARAGRTMLADRLAAVPLPEPDPDGSGSVASGAELERVVGELRAMMALRAGILRDEAGLREGIAVQERCEAQIEAQCEVLAHGVAPSRQLAEARSLCLMAGAILRSALARKESRGAHFRVDFPKRDDAGFGGHSVFDWSEKTVRFAAE
jgi:L-aspartate oxidase